jgi:molecular chaperone GrpE
MYKEMIPADVVAREAQLRSAAYRTNESPAFQGMPTSGSGSVPLQKELTEWKERCLRLAADFDNFKKRTALGSEYRAAELRNAFVRELLPVVDNLERALTNSPTHSSEQLREGVRLTLRQLMQLLKDHDFTERDDLGQPFDPRYHEAVCARSEPTLPDDTILEVWERCWLQGKALFRPAKVVVNDLKCGGQSEREPSIPRERSDSWLTQPPLPIQLSTA